MNEYLPLANFVLNLLFFPLLKLLWDIRVELVTLNGRVRELEHRGDRVDKRHDAMDSAKK